jgi:hypothetical protein
MNATATIKQADAQLSRTALLLISDMADSSPNEDVLPTREKAQEAVVAKPIEARKLRTC